MYFNAADWIVIAAYLGGMVALGLWFGKDQRTTRDYFLGSRTTPWWSIALSIVATETSAVTIISVPALAYGTDISFLQIIIGYVIARVVLAVIMVPRYMKGEIYSPYQLLQDSFGSPARKLAGGLFLVSETLSAGVRVYVAAIPIRLMLGDELLGFGIGDPILGAIVLFIVLSLVYTYVGGMKAVIWTDAAQFFLFMFGGLFTLFYIPTLVEGGWSTIFSKAAEAGKLDVFNPEFSLSMPFNIWMGLIGATFVVMSSHGAEQLIVQRVLACRNVADGRKALILSAAIIFPLFVVFLLVGVMLWAYYDIRGSMPIEIPEVRPGSGIAANDYIYPIFMMTGVPHVLRGFLVVAILAAAMSSVSSALNSLASVLTMDFVKSMSKGRRSEDFYLRFSRFSTLFWSGALILVAYLSREVEFVLNTAFRLRGLTSGALLGALALVLIWGRAHYMPVCLAMGISFAAMLGITQITWTGPDGPERIAWPWFTLIGTIITLASATVLRRLFFRDSGPPGGQED